MERGSGTRHRVANALAYCRCAPSPVAGLVVKAVCECQRDVWLVEHEGDSMDDACNDYCAMCYTEHNIYRTYEMHLFNDTIIHFAMVIANMVEGNAC